MELYQFVFWILGPIGAAIVYISLDLVSLLFLTNFQLGEWVRSVWANRPGMPAAPASKDEEVLEKRSRDLQKQKKDLEEQVARSGLGADMQPVPEPTVRDLSVPQAKGGRGKKGATEPAKEPAPAEEVEVISAREIAAASTADVLGRKSDSNSKGEEPKSPKGKDEAEKEEKSEPAKAEANGKAEPASPAPATAPVNAPPALPAPKIRLGPKKPKPITVASTPMIGNYQLPPMDFLQHPDPTSSRPNPRKN